MELISDGVSNFPSKFFILKERPYSAFEVPNTKGTFNSSDVSSIPLTTYLKRYCSSNSTI